MANQDELVTLLGKTALGDHAAFKALYDETAAHVYALLVGMVRRRDIADELLQETYVRVWVSAAEYHSDRGQVNTWLASIARYRALDFLRKRANTIGHEDISTSEPIPDLVTGTEIETRDQAKLNSCMDELSIEQRQSIAFAYFRGYTHDQIAASMMTPLGTVKSWVRRGLQSLRECIER